MPKTVDQLRTLNNPKLTYNGRVVSGNSFVSERGKVGNVVKNRPETTFEHGHSRLFRTGNGLQKESGRPMVRTKEENTYSIENFGPATNTTYSKNKAQPNIRLSNKINNGSTGFRNVNNYTNSLDTFDRMGYRVAGNNRTFTEQRTHLLNMGGGQGRNGGQIGIQDSVRETSKGHIIGNIRQAGNMGNNYPNTIVYDPNDTTRTTMRQVTADSRRFNPMGSSNSRAQYVYDPNDIARKTVKETTIEDGRVGIISRNIMKGGDGYNNICVEAPNTNRQFTSDRSYIPPMGNQNPEYQRYMNVDISDNKEQLLSTRAPVQQGDKVSLGKDKFGELDIKKLEQDRQNMRSPRNNYVTNQMNNLSMGMITNIKSEPEYQQNIDRLDGGMLDAFNKNPYTQSLSSHAFS